MDRFVTLFRIQVLRTSSTLKFSVAAKDFRDSSRHEEHSGLGYRVALQQG